MQKEETVEDNTDDDFNVHDAVAQYCDFVQQEH